MYFVQLKKSECFVSVGGDYRKVLGVRALSFSKWGCFELSKGILQQIAQHFRMNMIGEQYEQ